MPFAVCNVLVLSGIMVWGVHLGQVMAWVLPPPARYQRQVAAIQWAVKNPVMEISSQLVQ